MEKLFGIPMQSIMIVMLGLLALCLLLVAFIAWRRPVIFKMGMRNIPRRKTQSLLIVVGLMLATLIMSASLSVGDSLNRSISNDIYDMFGNVDEIVVYSTGNEGSSASSAMLQETIPQDSVEQVRQAADGAPVDGVAGTLLTQAPVINLADSTPSDLSNFDAVMENAVASNPEVYVMGVDAEFTEQMGGYQDVDGNNLNVGDLGQDQVYLNDEAAEDLNVQVGQTVLFFINNEPQTATVAAIVPSTMTTGTVDLGVASMVMDLGYLQELTGNEGQLSAVFVSNEGDARAGADHSDTVADALEAPLEGTGLGVNTAKSDSIEQADLIGAVFVTMFIGFGLFSISVGVLLIILIFSMLAAERRAEMGMARAVGAQRRQLIQQFISEGAGYTLIAGLVGTGLGIVAAWFIARATREMTGGLFNITLYVHPRSLIIAYALGVVITFLAVILSSWRSSRLNVVAALRNLPEQSNPRGSRKTLIFAFIGLVLGALAMFQGLSADQITLFLIGITLVPFALAVILIYFGLPSRLVLTVTGIFVIVIWLMPTDMFNSIFGNMGSGGIELFFLSGIAAVSAATLIIMQNLDLLLKAVNALGGRFRGLLSSVRLGISYPQSNPGRAGMTIAMFGLIVFSIVVMASVNNMFAQSMLASDANAGLDVRLDVPVTNTVGDMESTLREEGVNLDGVHGPGRLGMIGSDLDQAFVANNDGEEEWREGLAVMSADQEYLDLTGLRFRDRATGYESDEAIRDALMNEPNTMVIPPFSVRGDDATNVGGGGVTLPLNIENNTFEPYNVTMRGADGEEHTMKVIGVWSSDYTMLWGWYIGEPTYNAIAPDGNPVLNQYFFTTDSSRSSEQVAAEMEEKLIRYGVQGVDVADEMREFQSQQSGFMTALQWFMGLGLIVGVAAIGVISYRAVVERRQQIGVLRAIGFQPTVVGRAFVIETAIVVILGSLMGMLLGIAISYNLSTDPAMTGGSELAFQVPWLTVVVTMGMAIFMALLMSWLPARQASRVRPAEALRYE